MTQVLYSTGKVKRLALKRPTARYRDEQRSPLPSKREGRVKDSANSACAGSNPHLAVPQARSEKRAQRNSTRKLLAHVERHAHWPAGLRINGHQRVRAFDHKRPPLLLRISVNRSNVSRVA